MKKIYVITTLLVFVSFSVSFSKEKDREKSSGAEEARERDKWETMRLMDPATGKIPAGIREKELDFAATLPKMSTAANSRSTNFVYRGPINVGGRTRALAIDITNENVILAGSVNGGIYRSTNAGQSWTKVSAPNAYPNVTWICQDTRLGKTNIWYASTGEGIGASSSASGAYYLGNGLYKSIDGGLTWTSLNNTASSTPHTFDVVWDISWKVITDPSNLNNDVVYACCYGSVFKSTNGGTTWARILGSTSTYAYFSDIEITSTGVLYTTLSSDGAVKGVYRFAAGATTGTNITPTAWAGQTYNRVVIGINPQNENSIYVLGETPSMGKQSFNYRGDPEFVSLWKYTYLSGNGTGSGGVWTDLSNNIPVDGSQFGNFNSQGGYDLIVRVSPADSNKVYIGGTNLYRSTDGFLTGNNTTQVGGYGIGATMPMYTNYGIHHSDQHNIVFLPSNPDVMYQANDGGIYKTLDCNATPVSWIDLNNGYNTAQFYTVALDHATSNDIIIGGTQDFGTWFTNTANASSPWTHPGLGDGAYCAIADGGTFYYTSRQQGLLVKQTLDANGNETAYNRIDPAAGVTQDDYLFINPFILDPSNTNRMFWVAKSQIWRNDDLAGIPLAGQWDSIATNWTLIGNVDTALYATALGSSSTSDAKLYVGTNLKKLYRVDNPVSNPVITDITSTLFPNGYISCIAVDQADDNNVIVVFCNYAVYSIFYSSDGGVTFQKVAGNLEGNLAGTGSGPSVRWISIVPTASGNVYFAGTSTGLYATNNLNGTSTVWVQQASNIIGNLVVGMMDVRSSDGLLAVGTHGGGMFSATINDTLSTGISAVINAKDFFSLYPNPATDNIRIQSEAIGKCMITIKDVTGRLLYQSQKNNPDNSLIDISSFSTGVYYLSIDNGTLIQTKKFVVK